MKKLFIYSFLLFSSLSLFSCNNNDDDYYDYDPGLMVSVPQDMFYNGKTYVLDKSADDKDINQLDFVGYFVNKEDYEKRVKFDNNSDLIYIIDEENKIFRVDVEEDGSGINRLKLYFSDNPNEITVFLALWFTATYIYE